MLCAKGVWRETFGVKPGRLHKIKQEGADLPCQWRRQNLHPWTKPSLRVLHLVCKFLPDSYIRSSRGPEASNRD